MSDFLPLVVGVIIVLVTTRMAALRKWRTIAVGVLGFLGGTYCERSKFLSEFQVSATTLDVAPSPYGDAVPMELEAPADRAAEIMRFGYPGMDNVQARQNFVLSYDRRNRIAHWVCEHLTRDGVKFNSKVNRSSSEFFEDTSVHQYFRSTNADYKRSGFDRGHLAAAGNHRSSQAFIDETFVLSNIAPQVGKGFNRDAWNKLENYVRGLTKKYASVYVCTGPLYLPRFESDGKKYVKYQVVGNNNVAVPTHFYKVLVGETSDGKLDLETYVMPNQPIADEVPVANFLVPKHTIERSAGLLFFDKLPMNRFRYINGKSAASATG